MDYRVEGLCSNFVNVIPYSYTLEKPSQTDDVPPSFLQSTKDCVLNVVYCRSTPSQINRLHLPFKPKQFTVTLLVLTFLVSKDFESDKRFVKINN